MTVLLSTLVRVQRTLGVAGDDDKWTDAIAAASTHVRNYTGRKFEIAAGASTRQFETDWAEYTDIDDCTAITAVTMTPYVGGSPYALDANYWSPGPFNGPVYYWLRLFQTPWGSAEMGFQRNLDTYEGPPRPSVLNVTATWGWTAVPDDVQLAVALVAQNAAGDTDEYVSESIESYSRSKGQFPTTEAVPPRAQALLEPYVRLKV